MRLAQKRTLVQDDSCIETLARVDVLCVDKTGTITEPDMQVTGLVPLAECSAETAEAVMRDFAGNMNPDNITMEAIRARFDTAQFRQAQTVEGFSSVTKRSAVDFGSGEAYLLGAPEFLLGDRYADYQDQVEAYASVGKRVLLLCGAESLDRDGQALAHGAGAAGEPHPPQRGGDLPLVPGAERGHPRHLGRHAPDGGGRRGRRRDSGHRPVGGCLDTSD